MEVSLPFYLASMYTPAQWSPACGSPDVHGLQFTSAPARMAKGEGYRVVHEHMESSRLVAIGPALLLE